jgi:hypothetical protein
MNLSMFVFLSLICSVSLAGTALEKEIRNAIPKEDLKYLKGMPKPDLSSLRWYGKNIYYGHRGYVFKGKAIEVKSAQDQLEYVFKDKALSQNTGISLASNGIYHWGQHECNPGLSWFDCKKKNVLYCYFSYCTNSKKNVTTTDCYKPSQSRYSKNRSEQACPYSIDVLKSPDERSSNNGFLFRFEAIDEKSRIAEIKVNDKIMFLNIGKCIQQKGLCSIVEYKQSHYELDWIRLQKIRASRSDEVLNYFIRSLLPCVEKKDRKCIAKFFISSADDNNAKTENWGGDKVTVTDEEIEELKHCLRYESILPHGYAFRGKNKACIINKYFMTKELGAGRGADTTKLVAIEYPESIHLNKEYNNYYSPQRGIFNSALDMNEYLENGNKQ